MQHARAMLCAHQWMVACNVCVCLGTLVVLTGCVCVSLTHTSTCVHKVSAFLTVTAPFCWN